jgi:hypothetical protein
MLLLPPKTTKIISNHGLVGSTTPFTAVASSATTNTYGAAVELISAANNTQDSWGIEVTVYGGGASAAATQGCLDILIGGATDDVLIPGLLIGGSYNSALHSWFFPIYIPAGVRIAAQHSNVRTSISLRVGVRLYGGSDPGFAIGSKVIAYGTKINNSRGQLITPTASGGAASVTELSASSSRDHIALIPSFQCSTDTAIAAVQVLNIGIGVGAATEERIGTWWYAMDTQEAQSGPNPAMPAFRPVPSGTRLTMLASNSAVNESAYDGLILAVA